MNTVIDLPAQRLGDLYSAGMPFAVFLHAHPSAAIHVVLARSTFSEQFEFLAAKQTALVKKAVAHAIPREILPCRCIGEIVQLPPQVYVS